MSNQNKPNANLTCLQNHYSHPGQAQSSEPDSKKVRKFREQLSSAHRTQQIGWKELKTRLKAQN